MREQAGAKGKHMRTLEEAILLAMLNDDEARAEQLASEMLIGELYRFGEVLARTKSLVDRRFWDKKTQMPEQPDSACSP